MASRILEDLPDWVYTDPEFGAALYVLGSPPLVGRDATRHFEAMEATISWEALLEEARGWSPAQQWLVELACALSRGGTRRGSSPAAAVLVHHLEEAQLRCALTAMAIAGGLTTLKDELADPPASDEAE